ncbi:MAG TPA: PEP-CTERM sorting domain-containing protein [Isosphaeraceae bacterium]|nr:PEP-CTERM sorting domain-containing protein [Isosphaeraceae bacterium]
MKRTLSSALVMALGVGGLFFSAGSSSQADMVTYATTASINGGAPTYTQGSPPNQVSLVFGSAGGTVNSPTQINLGTFDTSGTLATATGVTFNNVSFALTVFHGTGSHTFNGVINGTLAANSSTAFLQVNGPLSAVIDGVTFSIVSADTGTPGRVNIAPETTNGGISTIQGFVTAVPEPSSLAMLALGSSVAMIGLRSRRRMQLKAMA